MTRIRAGGLPGGRVAALGPLVVLVVAIGLTLRSPIAAPASILPMLRAELGLGATAVALLTTIPVLCFAAAAPLAARVVRRRGPATAALLSMAGVLLAGVVRVAGDESALLLGTVLLGLSMTVGNIAVPVLIARDVPRERIAGVTSAYTASLNVGSVITSAATAPIALAAGWRIGLASGAVLAASAVIVLVAARGARARDACEARRGTASEASSVASVLRRPRLWLLAVAFGGQSFSYYALTAWLPAVLLAELGLGPETAGVAASLFPLSAIPGALAVPWLLGRMSPRTLLVLVGGAWAALPLGLLLAPQTWWLGCLLAGAAQGASVTLIFVVVARTARSPSATARLSALVHTVGYGCGALGPLALGAAFSTTGQWGLPLLLVIASAGVLVAAGWAPLRRDPERSPPGAPDSEAPPPSR